MKKLFLLIVVIVLGAYAYRWHQERNTPPPPATPTPVRRTTPMPSQSSLRTTGPKTTGLQTHSLNKPTPDRGSR